MSSLTTETPLKELATSRGQHVDAQEYFQLFVRNIERHQTALNAFIFFDAQQAETAFQGRVHGPLSGIPIGVKDNIVTRQAPTTCGSKILGSFLSPFDATAAGNLIAAGAVVMGKTNLDEFAMGSSTEHSAFGVTRNPWDLARVAGGSSGGSAAAVAARMVPAALGSETGGSVRQPAAFCGVFGMKPTYGRISRSGLVAFASSLDQIGIVTRTAQDCAPLLQAMAGHDPDDSTSSVEPVPHYDEAMRLGIRGRRFGVVREAVEMLDDVLRSNFEQALSVLRSLGAIVETVSVPTMSYAIAVYYIVANAEASANLARFDGIRFGRRSATAGNLREVYIHSRSEGFGDEVKRRIMLGTFALSSGYYEAYYGKAQQVRAQMRADVLRAQKECEFLLTPTTPGPAFLIGEKLNDPLSMYLSDLFTAPANLVGIPAVAVPSGFTEGGLPLSLQIMGRHFAEGDLLAAAHAYEEATGFASRQPTALAG